MPFPPPPNAEALENASRLLSSTFGAPKAPNADGVLGDAIAVFALTIGANGVADEFKPPPKGLPDVDGVGDVAAPKPKDVGACSGIFGANGVDDVLGALAPNAEDPPNGERVAEGGALTG